MRNKYIHALVCTLIISVATIAQSNKPTTVTHASATQTADDRPVYPTGMKINYVRTKQAIGKYTEISAFDAADYTGVKEATQYIDGLGRPLQTVMRQITPGTTPKDMVSPVTYDEFGREVNKYLPYVQSAGANTNDGSFKTDPFNDQHSFYQSVYPTEQPFYTDEQFYYGKTEFENSPLNRPLKTMAPGNSWTGSNVGVSIEYRVNTIDDAVHIWNITSSALVYDGDATTNIPVSPTTGGIYEAGQLYKTVTKDEQGNAVVEYKDKEGQTILKKVQSGDDIAADYSGYTGFLCTYYIYDDLNRLRFVIPPKAVKWLIDNLWNFSEEEGAGISEVIPELCFRYEYDSRQRMIAKKVPGAGWVYMVYDTRDRLVFTQDANMHSSNKWMATLYDELNRPVETGLITYSGTRDELQDYVNGVSQEADTQPVNGSTPAQRIVSLVLHQYTEGDWKASQDITLDNGFESGPAFTAEIGENGTPGSFENNIVVMGNPVTTEMNLEPLILNFYDDYGWTDKTYTATYNSQLTEGLNPYKVDPPTSANNLLKGVSTGIKVRILNQDGSFGNWLTTANFYDDRNRVIQAQQTNMNGGADITTNLYDFTGKILSNLLVHNNPTVSVINLRVLTAMEYDHAGKVLSITKKINDGPAVTIEENEYDMMGQLKTKKLGRKKDDEGNYTSTPLETLDYTYNIRGWLKGINKDYANNTGESDRWFGMELNYDWGFDHNQLNGNIAGTKWRSKGDGEQRAYGFGYDKVNRLLFADFNQNTSGWNKNAGIDFSSYMGNGIDATSAYDANGNIKGMKQWGLKGTASQVIDDLTYHYASTGYRNKLSSVNESATINTTNNKLGDFTDKNTSDDDYSYDANGNLTADKNKKITFIQYNHLNLPRRVALDGIAGGSSSFGDVYYTYDAAGDKLQKRVQDAATTTRTATNTNYISGFVYEGKSGPSGPGPEEVKLQFFGHEDGRVRYIAATSTTPEKWVYDYFIKDHLGNTRTVLTDEQQTDAYPAATMEIAQETTEEALYKNLSATRTAISGISGYPTDTYTNPNEQVAKTNGGGNKTGPAIILKVMAGDKFSIQASSWYKLNSTTPGPVADPLSDIVSALISGVPAISGGHISTGELTSTVLNPNVNDYLTFRNTSGDFTTKPKAYINAILLDDQFKAVNTNDGKNTWFEQVGEDQELKPHLLQEREITKNGYLYIYTSNEATNIDVFFDNLQVTHIRGPLVEETHYYPFGLTMSGISSKALKSNYSENKAKFNGIELNNDFDINMYDAHFRNLDPQIGRFWQIDPKPNERVSAYAAMLNNPILFSDPLGDTTTLYNQNGTYLGTVNDKLKNQVHFLSTDHEPGQPINTSGLSKKQLNALGRSFRNVSIAFMGSKTAADMKSIVDKAVAAKAEIGFVGTVGKDKEIRLQALPMDESNKINQVNLQGQVDKNYSSAEQKNLFLEGHTHIRAYVEGAVFGDGSAMDQLMGMGVPTKPNDYTSVLDRGNQAGVKGPEPSLLATPFGVTVYGTGHMTPIGQPSPNNSYILYKSLK
ncbi:MAG: DUF6443 domain-containing protein [Bacteroidota bacterium]